MGFFSSLGTESYDRQYTDRQLIQRIGSYFRIYWKRLLWIALLLLLIATAGALLPIIVSRGVDTLAGNPSNQNILQLAGLVLVAGVFQWFANWTRRRLTVRTVGDVVLKLRTDAFQAAVNHDLSFYDEFSSGRVVSRITSDTREFGQLILLVTDLFSQIAQAIILGVFLFRIQLKLSLYLFSFLPILFVVSRSFRKLAREVTRRGMRAMANVNAAIKETISGISIAKNFRQERTIYEEFYDANQMSYKVNVKRGFVLSLIFPVLNGLEGIGVAILTYVAVYR
ncbi:MAG: ABC transporter ATP-binding protein [Anaerolineales bacterium]|nr:ABC transporter ATP-binding protein [Anaerolineales bacterium]